MSESAATMQPDVRKRRSTRIVQAVPLVVSGVDALGRAFQEHTSTLIISCHGARYQSKHYVLKNMWVKLEVPHPEPGCEPRVVRGKVAWIQRPRLVKQLFQIALELEYPGNVWGIAFPPEDWFPFSEHPIPQPAEPSQDIPETVLQPEEQFTVDNVHFMRVSDMADALQAVREQVARLISEAHEEIRAVAREAVAEAAAKEASLLRDSMQAKTEEVHANMQPAASTAVERAFEKHAAALEEKIQAILRAAEEKAEQLSEEAKLSIERSQDRLRRLNEGLEVRAEEFAARMDSLSRDAVERAQARLDAALRVECERLGQQAEAVLADVGSRIEPMLESAEKESVVRLALQLEERLDPHRKRAEGLIERLATAQEIPEETLRSVQNRVQQLADEGMREAANRLRANLTAVENEFQQAATSVRVAWLAEFEQRADEIRSSAGDSLGKTAEWYEKKAQVQMQTVFDKGIEQAATGLREKAGEISAVLASELDRYSRTYVSHAQNQIDEASKDGFEHARSLIGEAADTTAAAFNDEIRKSAQVELEGFRRSFEKTLGDTRTQMEAAAEQARARSRVESETCLGDFRARLAGAIEQGVMGAGKQLETQVAPVMETWRAAAETHQERLREMHARLSDEAVESYKNRLDNVSNAWMLAAVTSLDQRSQALVASVARTAEERLREACSQAFAGIGESLRARLMEMASGFSIQPREAPDK